MLTARKAIELLEPIPAEDFLLGIFTNGVNKCCVMGHLTRLTSSDVEDYSASNCSDFQPFGLQNAFRKVSRKFCQKVMGLTIDISEINNFDGLGNGIDMPRKRYNEPIIKDRVMHFLRDMAAWEESSLTPSQEKL